MAWLRYAIGLFVFPGILGIIGAFGFGTPGATTGITLGLFTMLAFVGWSLRR